MLIPKRAETELRSLKSGGWSDYEGFLQKARDTPTALENIINDGRPLFYDCTLIRYVRSVWAHILQQSGEELDDSESNEQLVKELEAAYLCCFRWNRNAEFDGEVVLNYPQESVYDISVIRRHNDSPDSAAERFRAMLKELTEPDEEGGWDEDDDYPENEEEGGDE